MRKMVARKRFKRDSTLLEYLPNELFIEIFSYLSDVDTVCAFSRLNQRFHYLILNYCYNFNFTSVSKVRFDYVIRQHDIHRWRSLCLSDDDHTPGQINTFLSIVSFAEHISQLKALSMVNMQTNTAFGIFFTTNIMPTSCSLSIGSICGKTIPLLELSSLKHLVIVSCMHTSWMKVDN